MIDTSTASKPGVTLTLRNVGCLTAVIVAGLWLNVSGAREAPAELLHRHMAAMLTDGDEWRTPNPGYKTGDDAPIAYGLQMQLAPDGSHATGLLRGVYADGRSAVYWSLLALYNPVTGNVVTKQIGWDGTLIHGDVPLQFGDSQDVDTIEYNADGSLKIVRHTQRHNGPDRHDSEVYERDDNGDWVLRQQWTWHRHALDEPTTVSVAPQGAADSALVADAGYLLTGSGRWRAPNADHEAGDGTPVAFAMNYRWGPHGQFIVGEIVSHYADGRREKDWSIYITHNPVTGVSTLEQTGANGVYFRGELSRSDNGRHSQAGLIYLPNGQVKSVRDEVELVDADTRIAHVFERDERGDWKKVRQWTWRQQPVAAEH